ncbi:MAG: 50S ribosomal protein L29 [Pseudomonadota bacterium]|nr:50S ribosomal protein L29 [Gammaproteobacteria bacterium]MEC8012490.1 50S ribosomal protein L29 [Pseudomonadota bacterium]HBF07920.1 50S ribosomal protein L29 [Gammaproteobacteria bacterium]|tara:strand:+ start:219 stop:416 length:198 start_codon:yes stop_codon:yes gene_type:complete
MSQKTIADLKALDADALKSELENACKEHFELSLKHKAGSLKQTHLIRASRRQIARLNTLIHAKRS